jgi:hypothetical protein
MDKLYVVCSECGEAFDDLNTARAHEDSFNRCSSEDATYAIRTEEEAF